MGGGASVGDSGTPSTWTAQQVADFVKAQGEAFAPHAADIVATGLDGPYLASSTPEELEKDLLEALQITNRVVRRKLMNLFKLMMKGDPQGGAANDAGKVSQMHSPTEDKQPSQTHYVCFISHDKGGADSDARLLKILIDEALQAQNLGNMRGPFLDTDDLGPNNSHTDFMYPSDAKKFLSDFPGACTPSAKDRLLDDGITMQECVAATAVLLGEISSPFDSQASSYMQKAQVMEVVQKLSLILPRRPGNTDPAETQVLTQGREPTSSSVASSPSPTVNGGGPEMEALSTVVRALGRVEGAGWSEGLPTAGDALGLTWISGKLTRIDLTSRRLTGMVPPQLGSLINLIELSVCCNGLTGPIPRELGYLMNLVKLNMGTNPLEGPIPPELGKLTKLRELTLSWTRLTGTIPPELGELTELQLLHLSSNELTGTIPPELGKLTKLTELDLFENQLTGTIPPELGKLTKLTKLMLSKNQLTGPIPPELGKLTKLTELELFKNQLTGPIPSELGELTKLRDLGLGENQLTGTIPPELGKLTELTRLYGSKNQLTGTIPPELGMLTQLTYLFLGDNQLTGTIPAEFDKLVELKEMFVENNQLEGSVPTEMLSFRKLRKLFLGGNKISAGEIDKIRNKMPGTIIPRTAEAP